MGATYDFRARNLALAEEMHEFLSREVKPWGVLDEDYDRDKTQIYPLREGTLVSIRMNGVGWERAYRIALVTWAALQVTPRRSSYPKLNYKAPHPVAFRYYDGFEKEPILTGLTDKQVKGLPSSVSYLVTTDLGMSMRVEDQCLELLRIQMNPEELRKVPDPTTESEYKTYYRRLKVLFRPQINRARGILEAELQRLDDLWKAQHPKPSRKKAV